MARPRPTRSFGLLEGFLAARRADVADRLLPDALRAGRLLDLGCGAFPSFLQQTRFAEKIGCDPALRTDIDATAVRLVRCSIDRGALPFPSNHFTAVTMLAVIEHLRPESLSSVLTESYRVLEPGGRLVLTSPAPWTRGVLLAFAALRLVSRAEICDHKAYYGRRQLAELLARAGFASASVTCGSFQLAANNWASATK